MKREIIPAIDLMDGKCVRLEKGDFKKCKVYYNDPVEYIRKLTAMGIKRIHVVDLDGARSGKIVHFRLLEQICALTGLKVDFGGGIRCENDLKAVLDAGTAYVSLSSAAVRNSDRFESWIRQYGAESFILCADVASGLIQISGWTENSGIRIGDFIGKYLEMGVMKFLCTDIGRDGMMSGPSLGLYRKILKEFSDISLIASGGVAGTDDIEALFDLGVGGVVIGKALLDGTISLREVSEIMGRC